MARRLCSNGLPCHRILGAWRMPAKIAVGVITQRRPQQFATLLARLAEQDTPAGAELHFIFEMALLSKNRIRYNVNLPVGEDVQFGLECVASGGKAGVVTDAIAHIGGRERFDDARFRFRRATDEGMIKYGFHFRHLHVSNFHPVKTPVSIAIKVLTATLNIMLAALVVPGAKVRVARHAGIVAGAVKGCHPRDRKVSLTGSGRS